MNKSAQLRDFSQAKWPERRKSLTQQGPLSAASAAATLKASQLVEISRASTSTGPSYRSVVGRIAIDNDRKARLRTYPKIKTHYPPVFVKLAEENAPVGQSDSDSAAYDSFNEAETDFCKDESDYSDDYETDGFATLDVFEYEVDELSDSEDLESGDSSGTDDMVTEVVKRAIFASSDSDTDFGIFNMDADTEPEGSDVPSDPELGRADYWTCIKCKNQKNNPMYRFCEKCYQIRKTHFPPRPKHRRKRASPINRNADKLLSGENFSSPSSRSSASSTNIGKHVDDSDISDDQLGNQFRNESNQARIQRRRNSSHKQNHNSAGESSCCSSQEQSPDEQQSTLPTQYLRAVRASSRNAYCSENEPHLCKQNSNLSLFERNYPNSQETTYPISESSSQPSSQDVGGGGGGDGGGGALILGKFDSQTSTASDFSVDLPASDSFKQLCQQIRHCDANGDKCNQNLTATIQKCDSTDSTDLTYHDHPTTIARAEQMMTDAESIAADTNVATKKMKKRKIDFSDETGNSDVNDESLMAKKFRAEDETDTSNGMCMICLTEPKNGAFVHNRFLHVCACYRCTVKVWNKRKRCPICNSQVKTVLKMFVH